MRGGISGERVHEEIRCELISWDRYYTLARRLARMVRDAGFHPDIIVAIGRGGYLPARIVYTITMNSCWFNTFLEDRP